MKECVKRESRQNTIIKRIEIAIVMGIESARMKQNNMETSSIYNEIKL